MMNANSEIIAGESTSQALPETLPPISVGKVLSQAREKQGLSVADVAASIKFAPRQIVALEADDLGHLPELAFVRGFVRSYARLLHIDEAPLLATLPSAHKQLEDPKEGLADVPLSATQATRQVNLFWLFASLGVAALLGLGIWLFEEKPIAKKLVEDQIVIAPVEQAVSNEVASSAVSETPPVETAAPVDQVVKLVPPQVVAASAPTSVPITNSLTPVALPTPVVKAPIATVTAQSPIAAKLATPITVPTATVPTVIPVIVDEKKIQSGVGQIHLVFGVDSWVFITDKFGKTIHKQTNLAGTEQSINGRPPYNVTIANAKNVRLFYEGEEVELKEFTDVSVARLILE
jgi:cytoskeleton protein RodZ